MAAVICLIYSVESRRETQKAASLAQQQLELANSTATQKAAQIAAAEQAKADQDAALTAKRAAQEAAVEHAAFVAQYVNTNFNRTPGLPLVAVAVADENSMMNQDMSAALIKRFKGEHAQLVDSFFKPPLVSDGLFNDVFNGSTTLFAKLEMLNSVDALLLARQEVQYSTNSELNNVITANMRIDIVTLPVAGHVESHGWTFTANGADYRLAEARKQAEERIIKQINDKADMSLGLTN